MESSAYLSQRSTDALVVAHPNIAQDNAQQQVASVALNAWVLHGSRKA